MRSCRGPTTPRGTPGTRRRRRRRRLAKPDDGAEQAGGRVEAIWLKRAHRGPMDAVGAALAVPGKGLAGSVGRSSRRQITILERESWTRCVESIGGSADPRGRRANVLVSGISLAHTRGRVLRIGNVRVAIGGETTPCERMDDVLPGLRKALQPNWSAGVFGQILDEGTIAIGDEVTWERPR